MLRLIYHKKPKQNNQGGTFNLCNKNNIELNKNQDDEEIEILVDTTRFGEVRPWQEKKINSLKLAESYYRLGYEKKARRVRFCGSNLTYKVNIADGSKTLYSADFCKVRLCTMCAWRRSLKTFGQVSKVMDVLCGIKKYNFLFLTLTVKNCNAEQLSSEIDKLFHGYTKLMKRRNINKIIKGWFRALEVTHNTNRHSKSYDTYHPHFHVILQVNPSYFTSKDYLKHKDWIKLWRDVMNLDYDPKVHIEKAKAKNISGAVAEIAKYTVKDKDYIIEHDQNLTDESVKTLDAALHGRRLTAFGGMMKEIHKELNLDDTENGDLIHTDNDDIEREDLASVLINYHWNIGLSNYVRVK